MSEQKGALGAVFKGAAAIYTKNLVFGSGNEIANSDALFVSKGFANDQDIYVYGTVSNDGQYTIDTAATDTLVLTSSIASETLDVAALVYTDAPGTQITGFYGWTLNNTIETLDATDFADAGEKTFIAGDAGWTGTAQAHWMTGENVEQYIGTELMVRFFVKYLASPGGANVYFYEGLSIVTGISVETAVGSLVERPLTFTGLGPLVYRTLTVYP